MTVLSRASATTIVFAWVIASCSGERPAREHAAASRQPTPATAPPAVAAPAAAPTPPRAPAESGSRAPTIPTAGAATCRVGEAHELAVVDRLRTRVAVSFRGEHGLAAWATGGDELAVRPIDHDARPVGPVVVNAFRKAEGLEWLVPMPTGTIALASGQLCDRYGSACFQAVGLGDDGHALGAPFLHEPADQWVSVNAIAVGGDWLVATQASRWGYGAVRYRIGDDGAIRAEHFADLHLDGSGSGDVPLRAVAATTSGRGFVLAEYEGEMGGRRARLYDSESHRLLPPMRGFGQSEDGVVVDLMEIDGDAMVIVAERKWFRVGLDGRVLTGPERFRARDALPEGLRNRMVVSVEARRGHAVMVRRDLARAEVGEAVELVPTMRYGAALAQVAWAGDRFVVVAGEPAEHGIRVTARTVQCGSP